MSKHVGWGRVVGTPVVGVPWGLEARMCVGGALKGGLYGWELIVNVVWAWCRVQDVEPVQPALESRIHRCLPMGLWIRESCSERC